MGSKISCCKSGAHETPRARNGGPKNHLAGHTQKRSKLAIINNHINNHLNRNRNASNHLTSDGIDGQGRAGGAGLEASASSNLQHISEREVADDHEQDPSTNPSVGPLFMRRSRSDIHRHHQNHHSQLQQQSSKNSPANRRSQYLLESRPLKKSSSCSTIFIDDSTVSHPNLKNTIKCVSLAIFYHIKNRGTRAVSTLVFDIFDEKAHPLTKETSQQDTEREPDHRSIYRFMRTLFNAAQLPPECAIITLVYLERLLTYAETDIFPRTWKRILLGAILLASKVWDDQAVWNVDYCQILRDTTVEDMNELERNFLVLLQFNINVPSSVYAKYYFDLRTLADENELTFPMEPLSKERALRLEAMSKSDDKSNELVRSLGLRRWTSTEGLSPVRRGNAILS